MVSAKELAIWILRHVLATGTRRADSIAILAGPLRRKRLPRYLALANLAILFGQYEPAVVSEIMTLMKQSDIAYDIGAHIGFMTLALASRVGKQGRVVAFEPVPDNVVDLRNIVLLNGLEHSVSIVSKAVSNTTCLETMVLRESSSIHILEKTYQQEGAISGCKLDVETTTLDSFVLRNGHLIPNLLKIDVEGSEMLVIEGALGLLKSHSPTLLIEVHGPDSAGNLWGLLQEMGYAWWRVTSKGRIPISKRADCISPFSPKSWTHHFLMQKI